MDTLQDDLKKMSMLSGDTLDNFLQEMKAKYSSKEDKKIIAGHLIKELLEIKAEIADTNSKLTLKEYENRLNTETRRHREF